MGDLASHPRAGDGEINGTKMVIVRSPGRTPLHLMVRDPIVIGRECDGLLLDDALISRRHLTVEVEADGIVVTDLDSTNGTTVDGTTLSAPKRIVAGNVVEFGASTLEVLDGISVGRPGPVADDLRRTSIDLVADAFATERPDVREVPRSHGTTTIVFSDIESSTAHAEALGDQRWYELLQRHNRIVRGHLAAHHGKEIKSQGDGFMLSFPSARGAVQCMVAVQRELADHGAGHPEHAIRIRVGVHTGEAIVDGDGDLFGKHVILAARIANEAHGGEIVASSLVRQIVEAHGDIEFEEAREVQLKGLTGTYMIFPIRWEDTTPGRSGAA
jgi:class 3 adenylate cyclase